MVRRPDLGYRDEGFDFGDPQSFEPMRAPFGEACALPRAAFRSLQFLYLEDEAVWTRDWIPVGTVHEIPGAGDLLPFTLGYHGVHVQRMEDGALEARFNLAQHGGCRVVPVQCQQGTRTGCSFTSCGYSRDRGPIEGGEEQGDSRVMYQYLGLRPERLFPVQVARAGSLIFLDIDPDSAAPDLASELDLPGPVVDPDARRVHREWLEFDANWKFAGQALARVDDLVAASDRAMSGRRRSVDGGTLAVDWVFPNLCLLSTAGESCAVFLQHTAIGKTLFRVEILSDVPWDAARDAFWQRELAAAGARAEALQRAVPARPQLDTVSDAAPALQEDAAGWWLQTALTARFAAMPRVESDVPIFRNVEHYLI